MHSNAGNAMHACMRASTHDVMRTRLLIRADVLTRRLNGSKCVCGHVLSLLLMRG